MTLPDVTSLLPSDDELRARHRALVEEFRRTPQTDSRRAKASVRAHRPRPVSRYRRGVAIAAVVVVAGAAAAAWSVGPTGPVNVVAEAQAAAAPARGGVLHTVVLFRQTPELGPAHVSTGPPPNGKVVGTLTGESERWSSDDPVRWRSRMYIDAAGGETATEESSYADGAIQSKSSWDQTVRTDRLSDDQQAQQDRDSEAGDRLGAVDGPADPVTDIRRLLKNGKVRDEGSTTFGGRAVRRLVGELNSEHQDGSSSPSPTNYEYLVDADSFEPVRITSTQVLPAQPDAEEPAARKERTNVSSWTFTTFERLPATPENERLLSVLTSNLPPATPRRCRSGSATTSRGLAT